MRGDEGGHGVLPASGVGVRFERVLAEAEKPGGEVEASIVAGAVDRGEKQILQASAALGCHGQGATGEGRIRQRWRGVHDAPGAAVESVG